MDIIECLHKRIYFFIKFVPAAQSFCVFGRNALKSIFSPKILPATKALVSASPASFTIFRRPSSNEVLLKYTHNPAERAFSVYPILSFSSRHNCSMFSAADVIRYSLIVIPAKRNQFRHGELPPG